MNNEEFSHLNKSNFDEIRKELYKYLYFWPVFLFSIILFLLISFTYLRYAEFTYESIAKIEIIDKSQDSEMALPTAMTIFNRSMINLENEIGVLQSQSIHSKVISELNYNISYYTFGLIKTTENHKSEWYADYKLELKSDIEDFDYNIFDIEIVDNRLIIYVIDKSDSVIRTYQFNELSTYNKSTDLPFNLDIKKTNNNLKRRVVFNNVKKTAKQFSQIVNIKPSGNESDQLTLNIIHPNIQIAEEYLNTLINVFDNDGIKDRQLEYKRTMDFVDSRSVFLQKELELVENKKQSFKESNNLNDLLTDAQINTSQRLTYDSELFNAKSQKDLLSLLSNELDFDNGEYKLLPINIGLENSNINNSIESYNQIAKERARYINSAGPNNLFLLSLNQQLDEFLRTLKISVANYDKSLDLTIKNLINKEEEFLNFSEKIPNNEKILRSIERELEIKESLFLLLLQKREEAAINLAVVKPSIKIIDYASSSNIPVSPKKLQIYLGAITLGFLIPLIFIYIWFIFDDKIHSKEYINSFLDIPIIAEIPFISDIDKFNVLEDISLNNRSVLNESVRMAIANLKFFLSDSNSKNKTILVTSSIKGEGKTLFSVSLSKILSDNSKKVLLIGADLRNPQIHKFLNLNRTDIVGLSEYIYDDNLKVSDLIIKNGNLDILLSGSIPPNPTELLQSSKFKDLIENLKKEYDHIVIDSAPCLLVSDTLLISNYFDVSICMVRANHTRKEILNFLKEVKEKNLLNKISLALNGVGSNSIYGYKYSYKYKYSYGYNYGYGYGYGQGKD